MIQYDVVARLVWKTIGSSGLIIPEGLLTREDERPFLIGSSIELISNLKKISIHVPVV